MSGLEVGGDEANCKDPVNFLLGSVRNDGGGGDSLSCRLQLKCIVIN